MKPSHTGLSPGFGIHLCLASYIVKKAVQSSLLLVTWTFASLSAHREARSWRARQRGCCVESSRCSHEFTVLPLAACSLSSRVSYSRILKLCANSTGVLVFLDRRSFATLPHRRRRELQNQRAVKSSANAFRADSGLDVFSLLFLCPYHGDQ